jgi:hypothetical protein
MRMRRLVPWVGAFLVAALACTGAVVALNATVFGPGDFVRVYLDALARGDARSALDLPGVDAGSAGDQLLTDDVLTGLSGIRQIADVATGADRHRVTFDWTAPQGSGTTTFEVQRIGTRLGLFPEWGFAVSPTAVLALDVQHDPRFTANGVPSSTGLVGPGAIDIAVLVPGSYVLAHDSAFLRADDVTVLADDPGAVLTTTVDVEPSPAFAPALSDGAAAHLTACATQKVLFPTGCPFGETIRNRVVSDPEWTIVDLPDTAGLSVEPGPFGYWVAGPAPATAHLVVKVESLFDGSLSTFDQDVPFEARYLVSAAGSALQLTDASPPD